MSKPLELTIHERCDCGKGYEPHYEGEQGLTVSFANDAAYFLRFAEPELAAEYWHSWNLFKTGSHERRDWTEYDRANVLRRFAETPSYDEVTA